MNVVFEPVGIGEYLENFKNNNSNITNALYTSDDEREEERPTTTTKDEDKEEKTLTIGDQNQHLEVPKLRAQSPERSPRTTSTSAPYRRRKT